MDEIEPENKIAKEISKQKYHLKWADELIERADIEEIKTMVKETSKITAKLSELISQLEEFKTDIIQWCINENCTSVVKGTKAKYARLLQNKEKLSDFSEAKGQRTQEQS